MNVLSSFRQSFFLTEHLHQICPTLERLNLSRPKDYKRVECSFEKLLTHLQCKCACMSRYRSLSSSVARSTRVVYYMFVFYRAPPWPLHIQLSYTQEFLQLPHKQLEALLFYSCVKLENSFSLLPRKNI